MSPLPWSASAKPAAHCIAKLSPHKATTGTPGRLHSRRLLNSAPYSQTEFRPKLTRRRCTKSITSADLVAPIKKRIAGREGTKDIAVMYRKYRLLLVGKANRNGCST